jgi:hypothetical protein
MLERVPSDLIGRMARALHFKALQRDGLDPSLHGALPERPDPLLARDGVVVGWEHWPVLRRGSRDASRVAPTEDRHASCTCRRNSLADLT